MSRAHSLFVVVLGICDASVAAAEPLASADTWAYDPPRCDVVDAGLSVGFPSALPTGLARGIGVGYSHGQQLAAGVRASWMGVTESSSAFEVNHQELRLRALAAVQHAIGRGTVGLRVGIGGVLVRERRTRVQGMRAGLDPDEIESTALALLPTGSLEAVVAVKVRGPWSLLVTGGPTLTYDKTARAGWTAELGVAWQR